MEVVGLDLERPVDGPDLPDQMLGLFAGALDPHGVIALQPVDQPGADRVDSLDPRQVDRIGRAVEILQPRGHRAEARQRPLAGEAKRTIILGEVGGLSCHLPRRMRQIVSPGKRSIALNGWTWQGNMPKSRVMEYL